MKEIRDYLSNEQAIAANPGTPEWQVMNQLNRIACDCPSVDQFLNQARSNFFFFHPLSLDAD